MLAESIERVVVAATQNAGVIKTDGSGLLIHAPDADKKNVGNRFLCRIRRKNPFGFFSVV